MTKSEQQVEQSQSPFKVVENAIDDLQTNMAFNSESIAELEKTAALQHQEIQLLKKQIGILSEHLKSLREDVVKDLRDEAPPPHY